MTASKKYNLLFYGYNFTYFAVSCAYFGYLVRYLSGFGYSAFTCGVINMLTGCLSMVIQPLAGYLTDTFLTVKKYLLLSSLACMALVFVLPATISLPVVPVLGILFFALFFCGKIAKTVCYENVVP